MYLVCVTSAVISSLLLLLAIGMMLLTSVCLSFCDAAHCV